MINIELLKNHPDKIPALVDLWYESLGQDWMPSTTPEDINAWYQD